MVGLGRGRELEPLLPVQFQPLVFHPQGWISAVVLVDGFIKWVWEYKTRPGSLRRRVVLSDSFTKICFLQRERNPPSGVSLRYWAENQKNVAEVKTGFINFLD